MDSAPLNLAHFHERRANKLIKHHHYDEAYKAMETSVLYVRDAYKNVQIPKALEVLNTQVWDYERKLQQIKMRKQQYERLNLKEIVPPSVHQNENNSNSKTEMINAQSVSRSIDKTIKDFNDKYGSMALMINMDCMQLQQAEETQTASTSNEIEKNESPEEQWEEYDELPSLAPLELPSFDFSVFTTSGLVENFQK